MARRPSLDQTDLTPRPSAAIVPMLAPAAAPTDEPKPRAKGRLGKRGVAFWLNPAAFKQLGQISLDEDRSVQSLMEEATDLLFTNRGKHRLAREGE
jgi:hypothetical protein